MVWKWGLPVLGILLIGTLLAGIQSERLQHPWIIANAMCDSSRQVKDSAQRITMLEAGGTILRDQLAQHPYHARIWAMFGFYFNQKKNGTPASTVRKKRWHWVMVHL